MKKYFSLFFLLLLFSCVSSGPFKQEFSGNKMTVVAPGNETIINVSRQVDLNENSIVGTIKPGDVVTVIKQNTSAALIQMPNGNTGWVNIKYITK